MLPSISVALLGLVALVEAATPANQPHGYAPQIGDCPSDAPKARSASTLSAEEQSWLAIRRNNTIRPMRELLTRADIGYDLGSYIDRVASTSDLPNIGIAVSGGGYRAMLDGAGVLAAFDNRTVNSTSAGHLGGLLQAATYISALSGGGWLVGSLYSNNFTTVQASLSTSGLWQLEETIFDGPGSGVLSTASYYTQLINQVDAKRNAGFNVTVTDYWGRALSYQLINAPNGGPDYTFSSISTQDWFQQGTAPLPILIADGRAPTDGVVSTNSTVFEFNPWEFGSFDPTTFAFSPLKYLGTNYTTGKPDGQCVTGFDSASFVMGTSSSLFNAILTTVNSTNSTSFLNSALQDAVSLVLSEWSETSTDIATYPNPFYMLSSTDPAASRRQLTLVDGGEDGQNIPLVPLIQPKRKVDVIFAVDSSADTTADNPSTGSAPGWPDGYSLTKSYERSLGSIGNGTIFPPVPDVYTFINLGLSSRPSFFGCNTSNLTADTPLVVYLPNGPYSYNSNTSTFDMQYNNTQRNAIINNGYNMATQGNGTLDSSWAGCVSCAILSRSFERTKTSVPSACSQCFQKYCWNGTLDTRTPAAYQPPLKLAQASSTTTGAGSKAALSSAVFGFVAAFWLFDLLT